MTELLAPPLPAPRAGTWAHPRQRPWQRPWSERVASPRSYVLCPPTYFAVDYAINAWMDPSRPVDRDLAQAQWEAVRSAYVGLGHQVSEVAALAGQPDMVFAANGGLVVDGRALAARFLHPERRGEEAAHRVRLAAEGVVVTLPEHVNEGEGDFAVAGTRPGAAVLAGTGFRTSVAAHAELARAIGREVVTLRLVDPRLYHLDTALAVLDDTTVAVVPWAFDRASLARVLAVFPDVIEVSAADALVLGANAVSDGRHVVLEAAATRLADDLAARGFLPLGVDTSELRRAGGSVKCCTAERHHATASPPATATVPSSWR